MKSEVIEVIMYKLKELSETEIAAPDTVLNILFVDDEELFLKTFRRLFHNENFNVLTANSGQGGLEILKNTDNIGLIVSDQMMPEMTGSAFLREAKTLYPDIPRMILTGYSDITAVLDAINQGGAFRFLSKPWDEHELGQAVQDGLSRYRLMQENKYLHELVRRQNVELTEWNANLKNRVLQQTKQLSQKLRNESLPVTNSNTVTTKTLSTTDRDTFKNNLADTFIGLLELRSPKSAKHHRTVALLAEQIALQLQLDTSRRGEIRIAALLHDIGCIGMPDRLLNKNSTQMTSEESNVYQVHPIQGQAALGKFDELQEIGVLIRHHHEAFDGSGFPDGLTGEKIPLGARIIALANWIDIFFSRGVTGPDANYQISKILSRDMGRLFDPALISAANVAIKKISL